MYVNVRGRAARIAFRFEKVPRVYIVLDETWKKGKQWISSKRLRSGSLVFNKCQPDNSRWLLVVVGKARMSSSKLSNRLSLGQSHCVHRSCLWRWPTNMFLLFPWEPCWSLRFMFALSIWSRTNTKSSWGSCSCSRLERFEGKALTSASMFTAVPTETWGSLRERINEDRLAANRRGAVDSWKEPTNSDM